jgi:predicted nucleic acid-binding protein
MLRSSLDHGESEAIILYFEKEMDLFLVDDGEARKVAASLEITMTGTGAFCSWAKRRDSSVRFGRRSIRWKGKGHFGCRLPSRTSY